MSTRIREVEAGSARFRFPGDDFGPLVDSRSILDDRDALMARLDEDGYLFLPGLLDRSLVLAARSEILAFIAGRGGLAPDSDPADALINPDGTRVPLLGRPEITHHPAVRRVLENEGLLTFFEALHREPVIGFDFKWLRAVGEGEFTGVHLDRVYMGRGSDRLMTAWVPFGDLTLEAGSLCVCPGSHRRPEFARLQATYGQMDVDRDLIEGWLTDDPSEITRRFGGTWHTGDAEAGDVIVFGMGLVHASTTNRTDRWRISCDVRFQPAADPIDERWVGTDPPGHGPRTFDPDVITPMAKARRRWGV